MLLNKFKMQYGFCTTKQIWHNLDSIASSYVSRGGSLRDRASVPGVVPGAPGRLGSWITVVEPGGA